MSAQHTAAELQARAALRGLPLAADSARVGRTHRVVRERALVMQEARYQGRNTLWLPLTISFRHDGGCHRLCRMERAGAV